MIDLHAHILPGIDDGPAGLSTSLAMARQYVAAGYHTVVATPHARVGGFSTGFADMVRRIVDRVNRALKEHFIGLKVLPGMEVEIDGRLPKHIAKGAIIPLADKNHLLLETPFIQVPVGWQNMFYELESAGFSVVFAHPERCAQLADKPEILHEMASRGVRLQVDWGSLIGLYGRREQRLAHYMARQGLIHCLATDCHDTKNYHPGVATEVACHLKSLLKPNDIERIVHTNPQKVVKGLSMQMPMVENAASPAHNKRSWWRRLLS